MRIQFHKASQPSREVGVGSIRERCRSDWGAKHVRKISASSANATITAANLELGEGNAVFIRGAGAGLKWDVGQRLICVEPETWVWSVGDSKERVQFQLLLNDEVWEKGEPHVLEPGKSMELTPDFEWPEIPRISLPKANPRLSGSSR
jgi:hypothetical protein